MRPTFSIIAFTVLAGAGYGTLFLCALAVLSGGAPAPMPLLVGAVLVSAGLVASVGHLGQPLRAWRAFSQWRSSWLSREGVAASATYVPLLVLLAGSGMPSAEPSSRVAALLLAIGCIVTVSCTACIYSSLKPVAAWHSVYTLPTYLMLSLYSGTLWYAALAGVSAWTLVTALVLAPACVLLKAASWRRLDRRPAQPGAGEATGLGRYGAVASFEQPHTEENYLTHEMGFVLARKHARRLRAIAGFLMLVAAWLALPLVAWVGGAATWIAVVAGMGGLFVERWLFFAEARHAVMAYYAR